MLTAVTVDKEDLRAWIKGCREFIRQTTNEYPSSKDIQYREGCLACLKVLERDFLKDKE